MFIKILVSILFCGVWFIHMLVAFDMVQFQQYDYMRFVAYTLALLTGTVFAIMVSRW